MSVALGRIRVFILLGAGNRLRMAAQERAAVREAQLEVGWKRWKGKTSQTRGDGRCNRECMHSPVSLEGRTKTSTSPRAAAPAQHSTNLWVLGTGPSGSATRGDPWRCKAQRVRDAPRSGLAAEPSRLTRATGAGSWSAEILLLQPGTSRARQAPSGQRQPVPVCLALDGFGDGR